MMLSSTQLLVTASFCLSHVTAHVVFTNPVPRINSAQIYSFATEGPDQCGADYDTGLYTCNNFCGRPLYDKEGIPVTEFEVGVPVDITWRVDVSHAPYKFRLAINSQGGGDGNFDDPNNLLTWTDPVPLDELRKKDITRSVIIPETMLEHCSDPAAPCVMHLFDAYYFVSCANILLKPAGGGSVMGPEEMEPEPVELYPTETKVKNNWVAHTVMLANGTGEPEDRGFCPDISGFEMNETLSCGTVIGGTCQPVGTETSFGYTDNLTEPAIYATHYGGEVVNGNKLNSDQCGEITANMTQTRQGCLTAVAQKQRNKPNNAKVHIKKGSGVALYECNNYLTQQFEYTISGKFQITNPINNNTFCLGMETDISNSTYWDGVERGLSLMFCDNRTDPELITWAVTPEPLNVVDDEPMKMTMMPTTVNKKKNKRKRNRNRNNGSTGRYLRN